MTFYYYLHSNGQLMHLSQKSLDQKPDFLKLKFVHHAWYDNHNDIIIGNGDTPWDALVDLVKKEWKNSPNFRYEDGNFLC